jgi:hypothetical protein
MTSMPLIGKPTRSPRRQGGISADFPGCFPQNSAGGTVLRKLHKQLQMLLSHHTNPLPPNYSLTCFHLSYLLYDILKNSLIYISLSIFMKKARANQL